MRKVAIFVVFLLILVTLLIILAFFYIDLSGRSNYSYELLVEGRAAGLTKVDKYVTEDKVVYKSASEHFYTMEYPIINEKLSLNRKTMMPLKFIEEREGVKREKQLTLLVQNNDKTNFLFLEHPAYFTLEGFETGEKTFIFELDDVMLYMPIMERYNFWKRGAQFFEIMIPTGRPLPPMRDKIKVNYVQDEYIRIMGEKQEAESFLISAKPLPNIKLFLSKYTHRILALEIKERDMQFKLVNFSESPGKRIEPILDKVISIFSQRIRDLVSQEKGEGGFIKKGVLQEKQTTPQEVKAQEAANVKEIFFESSGLILSGRLWIPEGEGTFASVVMVPKDGPMTKGEKSLVDMLSRFLSASNFLVLVPDLPGQGKSQGSFIDLTDEKRIQHIISAVRYIEQHSLAKKNSINLLGHEGGGYLAVKAAEAFSSVRTCIILGLPPLLTGAEFYKEPREAAIQADLKDRKFGSFDSQYMRTITDIVRRHLKSVLESREDFSFFMGIKLPLKGYRDFLSRKTYDTILSFDRPILFIIGKDDRRFEAQAVKDLIKALSEKNQYDKVIMSRAPGGYMGVGFSLDIDVPDIIKEWLMENGVYYEEAVAAADSAGEAVVESGPGNPIVT